MSKIDACDSKKEIPNSLLVQMLVNLPFYVNLILWTSPIT